MSPPAIHNSAETAPSATELTPAAFAVPTLLDFINNVPPPLTTLLIELSPYFSWLRIIMEVMSWRSSYSASWMVIAVWWSLCLLSPFITKYALPVLFVAAYTMRTGIQSLPRPPVSERTLQAIVTDLSVVNSLIPSLPQLIDVPLGALVRVVAISYAPYLALTHYVRLRTLVAIAGTVVLTFRAPWAKALRQTLWRSAWFRWTVACTWSKVSGQRPSYLSQSMQMELCPGQSAAPLRFVFTVLENQRWWVGLDWTAALLPSERPSWCSLSLLPQAPPSIFCLPGPTTVFVGDGKGGMMKRTARWDWEESEWKVVVRRANQGTRRIEMALPTGKEESLPSSSKLDKTVKRAKEAKEAIKDMGRRHKKTGSDVTIGDEETTDSSFPDADDVTAVKESDSDDPLTDTDGWIYGDNQWKSISSSGGIGKYTRYRRWTRIATLIEAVEPASAEEQLAHTRRISPLDQEITDTTTHENDNHLMKTVASVEDDDFDTSPARKGIRNRLKAVVSSQKRSDC